MRVLRAASSLLASCALLLGAAPASAQLTSAVTPPPVLTPVGMWGSVSPVISAATSTLSLRINSGASQTIASLRDASVNAFSSPVSITTQWDLASSGTIDLVGYFSAPSAALTSGSDAIPSMYVRGRMRTGVATRYATFTQNAVSGVGTPGASLHLFRQFVIAAFNGIGQRTDNLELQLDLRNSPTVPAGSYTGTLTLRAIAY